MQSLLRDQDKFDAGVEQGREEGREEGKIEIAKNLLALDIPIKDIVKGTGLSMKEVKKLKEEVSEVK